METAKYLHFEKELFIMKCLLYLPPAFRGWEICVYRYTHTHTHTFIYVSIEPVKAKQVCFFLQV